MGGTAADWSPERVVVDACCPLLLVGMVNFVGTRFSAEAVAVGVFSSGGSEEGGSSPMLGFKGVRKGDLNGF